MKNNRLILLLIVVLCLPICVFAEIVVLKSGQTIEGKLIEKTDKYIKIDFQGVPVTYYFDEIERIDEVNQGLSLAQEIKPSQRDNLVAVSNNKTTDEHHRSVTSYSEQDNRSQARVMIDECTKAIEINPNLAEAYIGRAGAYEVEKNFTQAIADCTKAIEINPNNAVTYNLRAAVYYKMNEYAKAWEDVHKAEALGGFVHPGFIDVLKKALGKE